ncbi:MAG: glycosyltransferase family 25 protein [Gammaproteobacteria bacterium]|nr:glycosyltransferase family 25 protein [Gammaproteobacteria bacterium]
MTTSGSHRQGLAGKMACLAVTLPGCTERQASLEKQMARLHLDFEYVYGVEGRRLSEPEYYADARREFPQFLPEQPAQLQISPGESGCYLSFIRALRRAAELDCPYTLIIEDDVEFCFDDITVLEELTNENLSWDQLKLTYTEYPLNRGIRVGRREILQCQYSYFFYWRGIIGTTCNIYSRAGIDKLLRHCPRFGMQKPIDALISSHRFFMDFLPVFVRPALARENTTLTSTIVSSRGNNTALEYYLHKQKFSQRKLRQLRYIAQDLRHPVRSFIRWVKKAAFIWYCCKYLLWRRRRAPGNESTPR